MGHEDTEDIQVRSERKNGRSKECGSAIVLCDYVGGCSDKRKRRDGLKECTEINVSLAASAERSPLL